MKTCFIVPKKYFYISQEHSDFYLLLAHQIQRDDVDLFNGRPIVLDNGAYELGQSVSEEKIFEVADWLHPDEIVLPDVRFESHSTIWKVKDFLQRYYDERLKGKYRLLAPVQGSNWSDWKNCYQAFYTDYRIDCLGITDVPTDDRSLSCLVDKSPVALSRVEAALYLYRKDLFKKPVHVLGSIDPIELAYLSSFPNIEKTDSKIAFWNGVDGSCLSCQNGLFQGDFKREDMPYEFSKELSRGQIRDILWNIYVVKSLAKQSRIDVNHIRS